MLPSSFYVDEATPLSVMSWSDNLFGFGSSTEEAVKTLSIWIDAMKVSADYDVKKNELDVIVSSHKRFPKSILQYGGRDWHCRDELVSLGLELAGPLALVPRLQRAVSRK